MAVSGEIHYSDASGIYAALKSCLISRKRDKHIEISSPVLSSDSKDSILEMSSLDEDELDIVSPATSPFPGSSEIEFLDAESKAALAVWCAVKSLEASSEFSPKGVQTPLTTNIGSINYGEDEVICRVGHDTARLSPHQATPISSPKARASKVTAIDVKILSIIQRIVSTYPQSVNLAAGVLALVTDLWVNAFFPCIAGSDNFRKSKRKEQLALISSPALDIVVIIFRNFISFLEVKHSDIERNASLSATQVLFVLEHCSLILLRVCDIAVEDDIYALVRNKLTGTLQIETWFNKSIEIICSAKAAGMFVEISNSDNFDAVERALANFCRTGVALSFDNLSKCYLINPLPLKSAGSSTNVELVSGIASILCTMLALYATSPLIVKWVSRLTLALALASVKCGEGNFVKLDNASTPDIAEISDQSVPRSVFAPLCQALAASALIFHGKLLTQRPLFAITGTLNGNPLYSESEADNDLDAVHLAALHSQYKDHLRFSAVLWGLQAVGGLTFGRKNALYSPLLPSMSYSDSILNIPSCNRQFTAEVNAVDSVVDIFRAAVFDIMDGWTQPEMEGWSRTRSHSDIGVVSMEDASDSCVSAITSGLRLVGACSWCLNNLCTDSPKSVDRCIELGICEMMSQVLSFLYLSDVSKDASSEAVRELSLLLSILATSNEGLAQFQKENSLVLKSLISLLNLSCGSENSRKSTIESSTFLWLAVNSLLAKEANSLPSSTTHSTWIDSNSRSVKQPRLLAELIRMEPYDAISDALLNLHTSISTIRLMLRLLALLVRSCKAVVVALVDSAIIQPLVNVLAKYVDDAESTYFGCISLSGLLAINAGKKSFLYTSPISGIDVLVIIMTRYMAYGNYNTSISSDVKSDCDSALIFNLQSHVSEVNNEQMLPDHGVAISAGPNNDTTHDVLLSAITALVHFMLIPANVEEGSTITSGSLLKYQFSDALAILYCIGRSGAVKVIPKLLCQCLHDIVTALEASQHVATVAPQRSGHKLLPAHCFYVDIKLCKWLCRAIGAIGGVSMMDYRESMSQRRLLNSVLNTTTPHKNLSFDHAVLGNVSKMGMVMEVFEALLILSKYMYELTKAVLQRVSSPQEDFEIFIESSRSVTESILMACNSLSTLPDNRIRMRSSFLTLSVSTAGTQQRKVHGVNIFRILLDQLVLVENFAASYHSSSLSRFVENIRDGVCKVICNMCMSSDVGNPGITSFLNEEHVTKALTLSLLNFVKVFRNGTANLNAVNCCCSVLFAVMATSFRHAGNISNYCKNHQEDNLLVSLLEFLKLCVICKYDSLLVLSVANCINLIDINLVARNFFLKNGIGNLIHAFFESKNNYKSRPELYQRSDYIGLSHLSVVSLARLVASFTLQSNSDKSGAKLSSFYHKINGKAESNDAAHALVSSSTSAVKLKQFRYFAKGSYSGSTSTTFSKTAAEDSSNSGYAGQDV